MYVFAMGCSMNIEDRNKIQDRFQYILNMRPVLRLCSRILRRIMSLLRNPALKKKLQSDSGLQKIM